MRIRVRLHAAIVSTNIRSTRSSPRTITWRILPTVLAQPKPCSMQFSLFLRDGIAFTLGDCV